MATAEVRVGGQIFFLVVFAYGVCRYLLEVPRSSSESAAPAGAWWDWTEVQTTSSGWTISPDARLRA